MQISREGRESEQNRFPQDVIALEQKMSDWEIQQQQQ